MSLIDYRIFQMSSLDERYLFNCLMWTVECSPLDIVCCICRCCLLIKCSGSLSQYMKRMTAQSCLWKREGYETNSNAYVDNKTNNALAKNEKKKIYTKHDLERFSNTNPTKTMSDFRCSERVTINCSICGTRLATR